MPSATKRIISFIEDYRNGKDVSKYTENNRALSPNKGLSNSSSTGFGSNSPNRSPARRVKYNPDSKEASNSKHDEK